MRHLYYLAALLAIVVAAVAAPAHLARASLDEWPEYFFLRANW